jgi:hypothetical protein
LPGVGDDAAVAEAFDGLGQAVGLEVIDHGLVGLAEMGSNHRLVHFLVPGLPFVGGGAWPTEMGSAIRALIK